VNGVTRADGVLLVVDADDVLAREDVLLVFDGVRVPGHLAAGCERELPDGEVPSAVFLAEKNRLLEVFGRLDRLGVDFGRRSDQWFVHAPRWVRDG